jgi:hypothetical protein
VVVCFRTVWRQLPGNGPSDLRSPERVVYVPPAPTSTLSIATWCSSGLGGAACSRVPPVGILLVLGKMRRLMKTTAGRHALVVRGASRRGVYAAS